MVRVAFLVSSSTEVQVMTVSPKLTPVTTPSATVATSGLEESQVTALLVALVTVAVKVMVESSLTEVSPSNLTEITAGTADEDEEEDEDDEEETGVEVPGFTEESLGLVELSPTDTEFPPVLIGLEEEGFFVQACKAKPQIKIKGNNVLEICFFIFFPFFCFSPYIIK